MELNTKEAWLADHPWETVGEINRELCAKPETPHRPGPGHDSTRQWWETARQQRMTFREFLDLCRRCHAANPFAFFNGNTFARVLAKILEPVCQNLPSVEATMLRNAAAHYVAGAINARELNEVCRHVDTLLRQKNSVKP
ncbi:hypothetical protein NXS98_17350 [Fontisphaera persica]|uniref:hypothetical protein n=1 Tax=Fontisphaera persica TaxID=2974023 RepID=UPI0024C0D94E|nr:hypothetical protein [Fontisphaera persica]WCJ59457.1 hypothetical protein NXS98_17350 [Fontisphaera persica]